MPRKYPPGYIMPGISHVLDCHDQPIEVIPIADLHIGDPNADMSLIKSLINGVRENPNRYTVLCGDLMNTAIIGSKSDTYGETLRPSEQLERCADLLEPIRDKILAIVPGNHEERISRTAGSAMTRLLARELGLLNVYSDTTALVFLRFGREYRHCTPLTYTLYIAHGHGGGRRPGGKINALQEMSSIIDADVYIMGHTHQPAILEQASYRVVPQRHVAVRRQQVYINTASSLAYGGFGRRGGYQPARNLYPVITLCNTEHQITATL